MRTLFVTNDSVASWLITGFDSSRASHCGIAFAQRPGMVLDATWSHGGVRWYPEDEWLKMHGRRLVAEYDVALPDEGGAYAWACMQFGKGYDYGALFGMALLRDWQDDAAWYCFELAIAAHVQGGLKLAGRTSEMGGRLAMELVHAWCVGRLTATLPSERRYPPEIYGLRNVPSNDGGAW